MISLTQLVFTICSHSVVLACFEEKADLEKEIAELEALRTKKAQLLAPPPECVTPLGRVAAPTPKTPVARVSPPSVAGSSASLANGEDDDDEEVLLYMFNELLYMLLGHNMSQ